MGRVILNKLKATGILIAVAVVVLGAGGMALRPSMVGAHDSDSNVMDGHQNFQAVLTPLNGSDAYGVATGTVWKNNWAHFHITVKNLINAPHAQHVHFGVTAIHECPATSADINTDNIVDTTEGNPSYGEIQVSLTTKGDISPASALAVDRFPTYAKGAVYDRTFQLNSVQAQAVRSGLSVVVLHGIDTIQKDGKYDGDAVSDLDASLPQEATAPAACGPFHESV